MLGAAIINGIVMWIKNVVYWFMRVWYALKHANIVSGIYEDVKGNGDQLRYTFRIDENGTEYVVTAGDPKAMMQTAVKGKAVELLWVYGRKRAIISQYRTDDKSRKTLLICDVISVIAVILFIGGYAFIMSNLKNISEAMIPVLNAVCVGSIAAMIIASIVRKKLRKT